MLLVVVAMLLLVLSLRAHAQTAAPKPPVLSDVQKLQILGAAKDLEIAQLKLDAARLAMQQLITAVTPAGYQITDKLELAPVPTPAKDPTKEK